MTTASRAAVQTYDDALALKRHPPRLDGDTLDWVFAWLRIAAEQAKGGPQGMAGAQAISKARRELMEEVNGG